MRMSRLCRGADWKSAVSRIGNLPGLPTASRRYDRPPSCTTNSLDDCASPRLPITSVSMNLEDNLGDIISKARVAAAASVDAVAALSGLSGGDYVKLEDTGQYANRPDLKAIASMVGLHGAKLEGIAGGWLPQKR